MDIKEIVFCVIVTIIVIGASLFLIINGIQNLSPTKMQIKRKEKAKLKAEQKRIKSNMQEVIYVTDDILKKIKGE